jgi:hypothetical protein
MTAWTILALVISPLLAWAFVAAMKPPAPTLELEDQGGAMDAMARIMI